MGLNEQSARKVATENGIELPTDRAKAKEKAKSLLNDPKVTENGQLYMAIYCLANLQLEKVIVRDVKDLQRAARRHEDIARIKPHRKTN